MLSLRGEHDFVTEARAWDSTFQSVSEECVNAWRGIADAGGRFAESFLGGCGHNAHLEARQFLEQMSGRPPTRAVQLKSVKEVDHKEESKGG